MPFIEPFRPDCFKDQFNNLFNSKFPKCKSNTEKTIDSIIDNPLQGDRCPGYGQYIHIRKIRQGLKEYKISKRDGLRLIWLLNEEAKWVIMVTIYYKKECNVERRNVEMVRQNLKSILAEIDNLPD